MTPQLNPFAGRGLPAADAATLDLRWQRWGADLIAGLEVVYPPDTVQRV